MTTSKVKQERWNQKSVPMDRWGKDHWTTLLYLETRAVNYRGKIAPEKMRTSRRNRHLAGIVHGQANVMGVDQYPTRLVPTQAERAKYNSVDLIGGHDDWECMYDMADAGLLTFECATDRGQRPLQVTVQMTDKGREVCKEARARREKTARAAPA